MNKQSIIFAAGMAVCMVFAERTFAQKETYDVVSYAVPKGWKKEMKENGVQIYTGNEKTGEYSVALIIKSSSADGSANGNFLALWEKLVKGTVVVSGEPVMSEALKEKGWDIVSGQANYTDGGNKGVVTLVAATGGGKVAAVVLMANTDKYQSELQEFLHSLEMSEVVAGEKIGGANGNAGGRADGLAGKIWEGTSKEKFVGGTMNGFNTGGYFTYQYKFGADGTYRYVYVGASVYTDGNVLQYESGRYSISGNQLTFVPVSGNDEEWSVEGGPVKLSGMSDVQIDKIKRSWGKKVKTGARKLEKRTCTFKVEYMEGNHANALVVQGNEGTSYYFETAAGKSAGVPLN